MSELESKNSALDPDDGATRDRILAAATQCFLQLGIAKTTMRDVADSADLSRGTVYRYFPDRRSLVDATISQHAQRYYDEAAVAMSSERTLAAQIGAFAEVFARTFASHRYCAVVPDDLEVLRIMASDIDGALGRMTVFLQAYVRDAKTRGEIEEGIDDTEASELLARMLMSVTVMPESAIFDVKEPRSVRRYLERHAVDGLGARL